MSNKTWETRRIQQRLGFMIAPLWLCECGCNEIVYNGKKIKDGHQLAYIIKKDPEHQSKMASRKRETNGWLGRKHKEESKNKIGNSQIGILNHNFGKIMPEEIKLKISIATSGENNGMYNKPAPKGAGRGKGAYYNSPLQGQVWTGSSWERLYAQYLEINNIPYMYEDRFYHMIFNNRKSTYRPDFRLYPDTEQEEFIDVKGWEQWNKEKIICFKEQYPNIKLKVLLRKDLKQLGIDLRKNNV